MSQILGLPLETWMIVLLPSIFSIIAPSIAAIIIIKNKKERDNE